MAELKFYFGVMGSAKTANALMTRFQYVDKGKKVWLIKPSIDNRDNVIDDNGNTINIIKSRVGIQAEADAILPTDSILKLIVDLDKVTSNIIICDEAQFLTAEQVEELRYIATYLNIPVLCYGLRTDFQTHLFTGSKRLFELADDLQEIKSVCSCGRPAIINAKLDANGDLVVDGDTIDIGGDEKYEAMCWKNYNDLREQKLFNNN